MRWRWADPMPLGDRRRRGTDARPELALRVPRERRGARLPSDGRAPPPICVLWRSSVDAQPAFDPARPPVDERICASPCV